MTEKSTQLLDYHSRMDEDDKNVHYPKKFLGANAGDMAWKDASENLDWVQRCVLPPCLNVVSPDSAPPTEKNGDIYILDLAGLNLDVDTIGWQADNTIRYVFAGAPDLSTFAADYYMRVKSAGNDSNNGTFIITTVNDGADWIEITNLDRSDNTDDERTSSPATAVVTHEDWDANAENDYVKYDGTDSLWYGFALVIGTLCINLDDELTYKLKTGGWSASVEGKIKKITVSADDTDVRGISLLIVNTLGGNVTIGGFVGGVSGQRLVVMSGDDVNNIILENIEGVSEQDIKTSTGADITITTVGGVAFLFTGTFWKNIGL